MRTKCATTYSQLPSLVCHDSSKKMTKLQSGCYHLWLNGVKLAMTCNLFVILWQITVKICEKLDELFAYLHQSVREWLKSVFSQTVIVWMQVASHKATCANALSMQQSHSECETAACSTPTNWLPHLHAISLLQLKKKERNKERNSAQSQDNCCFFLFARRLLSNFYSGVLEPFQCMDTSVCWSQLLYIYFFAKIGWHFFHL